MLETLQHATEISPEELEQDRVAIVEQAIAHRVIDLCTDRGYNFGDPMKALYLADTPSNID